MQYWFVHHGKIDVPALYNFNGRYRYTAGVVSLVFLQTLSFLTGSCVELACPAGTDSLCSSQPTRYVFRLDLIDSY